MKLDSKTYDILKWVAQICIPAVATFVFALSNVFGFPADKIVGTMTAVDALLGALLGISSSNYYKENDGQK